MEIYIITGMDRGCLSSRESPILHWKGLMEVPGLAASHTLELRPTPKWTDGCPSSREFPILQWNGLMEKPGLAASHTSEDEKAFYAFLRGTEEGGLCPRTLNWMWGLAGSALQDRGGPSKHWKVAALMMYNAQSLLICENMICEHQ